MRYIALLTILFAAASLQASYSMLTKPSFVSMPSDPDCANSSCNCNASSTTNTTHQYVSWSPQSFGGLKGCCERTASSGPQTCPVGQGRDCTWNLGSAIFNVNYTGSEEVAYSSVTVRNCDGTTFGPKVFTTNPAFITWNASDAAGKFKAKCNCEMEMEFVFSDPDGSPLGQVKLSAGCGICPFDVN